MQKILAICVILLVSSCNVVQMVSNAKTEVPADFFQGQRLYLNITYPELKRDFYTHRDSKARTINFDYPWDAEVSCSEDAGATWFSCSGNSFVWSYANYAVEHHFKVYRGSDEYLVKFTPSAQFPGLTFAACTNTFSTSDSIQNTFATLSPGGGEVICLDDGVVIDNDGNDNAIGFAVPNIKVVADLGTSATIRNINQSGTNTVDTFGRDNTSYYGLKIEIGVIQAYAFVLSGNNSNIWECDISSTNVGAYGAVSVAGNGANKIAHSILHHSGISSGEALKVNNATVNIESSEVKGGYTAIYIWQNNSSNVVMNINNSFIQNFKTDYGGTNEPGTILFFTNSSTFKYTVNLSDSKVESDGGPVIAFKAGSGDAEVTLNQTKLYRAATANNNSSAVINANNSGSSTIIADTDSYFCNLGSAANNIFNLISSDPGGTLSFNITNMNAHTGGNTSITVCP